MYQEALLEHYKYPYNKCKLDQAASFATELHNPSCGDSISMEGIIVDDKLTKLCFQGKGCVISQATASMLIEDNEGKTITELLALNSEDVIKLIGMDLGPVRLKCALLPLQVLQSGIQNYLIIKKEPV